MFPMKPDPWTSLTAEGQNIPPQPERRSFAKVTFDADYFLILEFMDLVEILPDHISHGGTYVVDHIEMTQAEFDALPEFQG